MGAEGAEDNGEGGEQGGEAGAGGGGHAVIVCHGVRPRNPGIMNCCLLRALAVVCLGPMAVLAQQAEPVTEDFESMTAGPPPDALMVIEGEWAVVKEGDNTLLELQGEPVVDAAILVGPSMKEASSVRAAIRAGRSRRAFPRLGVGLFGLSGVKVRVVPVEKKIELLHGDEVVVEAAFEHWKEDVWWQVELKVTATGDAWSAEARIWPDGEEPPTDAAVRCPLASAPGQGRASVLGSPFAGKPIHFDRVTVQSLAPK